MPENVPIPAPSEGESDKEWTPGQLAFIDWYGVPKGHRKPKTQAALARKLKVNEKTLRRWKKLPGFGDALFAASRRYLDLRFPNILGKMGDMAEDGDLAAMRLAGEVTNRFVPVQELRGSVRFGADVLATADEELRAWHEQRRGVEREGEG